MGKCDSNKAKDITFPIVITATAPRISARGRLLRSSRRPPVSVSTRVSAPAARGSGGGHWHRRVPMLRHQICGNVFERSGVPRRAVSFAAPQPEWRDAGLPGAKRRDADSRGVFFCLLCLHEQEKKVARRGETRLLKEKRIATPVSDTRAAGIKAFTPPPTPQSHRTARPPHSARCAARPARCRTASARRGRRARRPRPPRPRR